MSFSSGFMLISSETRCGNLTWRDDRPFFSCPSLPKIKTLLPY